jgi:hypothetical protein
MNYLMAELKKRGSDQRNRSAPITVSAPKNRSSSVEDVLKAQIVPTGQEITLIL